MKVFLSYHDSDRPAAEVVRGSLEKAGFRVWDPGADLGTGDSWFDALGEELRKAEAMVVLLSPDSVDSRWVKKELDTRSESVDSPAS